MQTKFDPHAASKDGGGGTKKEVGDGRTKKEVGGGRTKMEVGGLRQKVGGRQQE